MLHPTKSKTRIQALDLLRGIAILGILIMNIQSFSMPGAAYFNPTAYGDFTGAHWWVWAFGHLFADQKFMALFSILFGGGVILFTQNAEEKTGRSAWLHYKRTFWLLVIGFIHAHFIWYGDILVPYALCGILIYVLRKKKPLFLFVMGLVFILVYTFNNIYLWTVFEYLPEDVMETFRKIWSPTTAEIQKEVEMLTSNLNNQLQSTSSQAFLLETTVFLSFFLWRAGGLMLVGMALFKWGILTAKKSIAYYKKGALLGFVLGLSIILLGMYKNFHMDWSLKYSYFIGAQFNYIGSLFVAFGILSLVMWLAKSERFPWWQDRLAAVGRMALTNYLLQSIIGAFIFYSVGLGLFGQIERLGQFAIVIGVWILQLLWSKPWLTRFNFGPFEWIWRSLTYWKLQPFSKKNS